MEPNYEEILMAEHQKAQRADAAARTINGHHTHSAEGPEFPAPSGLERICCNGRQLRDMSDQALKALQAANNPPVLFARAGAMVEVVRDENGRQVIRKVDIDSLCGRLARAANFFKVARDGGEYDCPPPPGITKDLLTLPPERWAFPVLDAVTEIPILRPDGSILDTPGYDPVTQLYYAPDLGLQVPPIATHPSSDHIEAALYLIDQAIGEFPYVDDASRANAMAAMLTPIIKPAIDAPAPLGLFDAPQAGTGKSLLCDAIAIIATGRPGKMYSAPRDNDEWRKQITAALNSGTTVVIYDNITKPIDNADLCSVLTASIWADRAMATHNEISFPVKTTFFATGNNIRLAGDMPRRCYRVRLDAKCSRPFTRTRFKIENLKAWVTEHRGVLLAALLTLARAWYVTDKTKPDVKPLGSFEAWTIAVGGILQHAGVKGFMANAEQMYDETDEEAVEWEMFLKVLREILYAEPFTVAKVAETLREQTWIPEQHIQVPTPQAKALKAALPARLAEAVDKPGSFQVRIGKAFSTQADRRFGESAIRLTRCEDKVHSAQLWKVEVSPEKTGEDGEDEGGLKNDPSQR
jgi:hypothetical protein